MINPTYTENQKQQLKDFESQLSIFTDHYLLGLYGSLRVAHSKKFDSLTFDKIELTKRELQERIQKGGN